MNLRRFARFSLALSSLALVPLAGCRQVLDIEDPVECGSDDACTQADSPCIAGECVDGYCAYSFRAEGTVIDEAAEDDCRRNVCDGNGAVISAVAADDAPPDDAAGDCVAPTCDEQGNVVVGGVADPPADMTIGDCQAPACEGGAVVAGPKDDDLPTSGDEPGDCTRPTCQDGAIVDEANDDDSPVDMLAGNCLSPTCDNGQVVEVANEMDAPAEDVDGDCRAPACDMGGMQAVDDTDLPTTGCGGCMNGAVVPWAEDGTACYTGEAGTQNVGICVGGTWTCDATNVKVCAGEQVPISETCAGGGSGQDDDCDGSTDEEGTGCNCQLGQMQACYTGPGGTQNIGICDDGVSTCQATGQGNQFGPCVGEVLPQACDSCIVAGDQDCSGTSATCTAAHVWSKAIGGADFEYAYDIQAMPNGEVMFVGTFGGSLTAGNTVTSDGSWDGAVVRLDADGNAINIRDFGGAGSDTVEGITLLDDGYLIFGRLADGSSETFGSGATLTGVAGDGFVAKFNNSHSLQWKKLIGGNAGDAVVEVVRMPDNGIAVAGTFNGTINLGGSNLVTTGVQDIFVARFDAAGTHVWSKKFGNASNNYVADLAVAPNGDLVIVGTLTDNLTFGSTTITAAGETDAYVVRMDDDGTVLWVRAFQSAGTEVASAVGILSDGSVWVGGDFDTAVNLNGLAGSEISPTSTGEDILMVKYDAAGVYVTAKAVNGTGQIYMRDIAVGADDAVVISGAYDGSLFFSQIAAPADNTDPFLFKISPTTGNTLWAKKPGGASGQDWDSISIGTCGDIFVVGDYFQPVNVGGGDLPAPEMYNDYMIAKYRQ